ncbi:MAG: 6,7-dimethyl-8-ribityllumazine synthase [Proteobacteria bacterium]|nr:6,7-dimethyl-8-ribityllumazine synthase [Pseudomonadota bacterium]
MAEAARRALPDFDAAGAHFVLVEGRFYDDLNDMLIAGARAALEKAGASVEVVTVPGALEIPVAIEILQHQVEAGLRRIDGYVALGVVIRGETTHYEIVSNESARELIALASRRRLAFGNGILTVENHDQAETRANPAKSDKGGDAARAALALHALKMGPSR